MSWLQSRHRRRDLRVALWALLLLAGNALQVVAATHWHSNAISAAVAGHSQPQAPAQDGIDHDGCLLCQVAAHAGNVAPPPAPWIQHRVEQAQAAIQDSARDPALIDVPSHAWQGRAPPRV